MYLIHLHYHGTNINIINFDFGGALAIFSGSSTA